MTYYEELGISPRASEAEVKRSYKRLTLLLHPDQHLDPEIKALADTQMKRLNEIVRMLLDPEQRQIYDSRLLENPVSVMQYFPPTPLTWIRDNRTWLFITCSFFLFVGAALLIPESDPVRQPAIATTRPPVSQHSEPAVARRLPRAATARAGEERASSPVSHHPSPVTVRSQASAEKPETEAESPAPTQPAAFSLAASTRSGASTPVSTPAAFGAAKPTPEASALAGKWVFTPDPLDRQDPNSFPAEYVELTIVTAEGRLRGNYRSRYRLPDHPLSPYANFTFEGGSGASSFDWDGVGGARGQITLHLQSHDSLQVIWFATKMGTELSLGSGSATVFRFR